MPPVFTNPSYVPPPSDGSGVTFALLEVADAAARLALPQPSALGRMIVQADDGSVWAMVPNGTASSADSWTRLFGLSKDFYLGDLKKLSWIGTDGVNPSGAFIQFWQQHDSIGGELLIESPWRIALLPRGPVQFGRNNPGIRDAACLWMVAGYADATYPMRPSRAHCFQTTTWSGGANHPKFMSWQAVPLDTAGNSVLRLFDNATVTGEEGFGDAAHLGEVTGDLILEIAPTGVWSPGTAPSYAALADGATVTLACDKHTTFQNHSVTLGGNRTLAITGALSGMRGTVIVEQDATGSRTLTLPGNSATQTGFALSTAAYSVDRLDWVYDGSYFYFSVAASWNLAVDADAATFLAAASVSDVSVQGRALNKLTLGLKAASLWAKIHALYPFLGGNATAHALDLKNAYNGSFAGTVTHNANGITGNGTTGYFNTGFAPSAVAAKDSFAAYVYCRTQSPTDAKYLFGASGSDSSRVGGFPNGANFALAGINANTIAGAMSASSDFRKHLAAQRSADSTCELLVNTLGGSMAGASLSACNRAIYLLARNDNGSADNFSNANLGLAMFSAALTSGEWVTFTALVDAYQTALSRKNP